MTFSCAPFHTPVHAHPAPSLLVAVIPHDSVIACAMFTSNNGMILGLSTRYRSTFSLANPSTIFIASADKGIGNLLVCAYSFLCWHPDLSFPFA